MPIGRVKWFNNAKGFGFVLGDEEGGDYFAHFSSIQMDGFRTLKAGQAVSFELAEGPKGLHAVNIQPLDTPADDIDSAEASAAAAPQDSHKS